MIFLSILFSCFSAFAADSDVFRLHLLQEPSTLATFEQKSSAASYFLSQIYASLLSYRDGELKPNLAEKCAYLNSNKVQCTLKENLKWSDGSPLTAEDFVKTFRHFLNPENHAVRADLLFPVRNARDVYTGKKKASELGIRAKGLDLTFQLESADREFIYNLSSFILSPQKAESFPSTKEATELVTSGPYKIKSWITNKKIVLESNPFYWKENKERPQLEMLFVAEDSVSLNLFEKGELTFLRRLPVTFIPRYRGKIVYFEIPQMRFDYIGFGPQLKEFKALRQALSEAINYNELTDLFHAKPRCGCTGLDAEYLNKNICLDYNLESAKKALATVENKPSMSFAFSKQGGDSHKQAAEWMQAQWQKTLGIKVSLEQQDNKIFVDNLEKNPPPLFRKGIAPERPTCLAALEAFQTDNPENYIKLQDKKFQNYLAQLKTATSDRKKRELCTSAVDFLLKDYWIIPTGPIFFSLLVKENWTGWNLNELNQLDLADLKKVKK